MFSGIIEEVGTVKSYDGEKLVVRATNVLNDLKVSESIMLGGACLTVTALSKTESTFTVETVPETINRTNFNELVAGSRINLERSLRYGDRVGGHMVQGHVDGVGTIRSISEEGNSHGMVIEAPTNIIEPIVEKGFITVDGISLTIVDRNKDNFRISIIPYTYENTTLKERQLGSKVNIEIDVTAKYVANTTESYLNARKK